MSVCVCVIMYMYSMMYVCMYVCMYDVPVCICVYNVCA